MYMYMPVCVYDSNIHSQIKNHLGIEQQKTNIVSRNQVSWCDDDSSFFLQALLPII